MRDRMWLRKLSLACATLAFCTALAGAAEMYQRFPPRHLRRQRRASGPLEGRSTGKSRISGVAGFNRPSHRSEEVEETNPLVHFWNTYKTGPGVHKWVSFLDVYHEYFKRFRGRNVRLLQIGVQSGGDIKMWQDYFKDGLEYHGMDINPGCKKFETERSVAQIIIGDQGSPGFWDEIIPKLPMFDIIIDDGGHTMMQQILTFQKTYPTILATGGVYLVEDTATSVWKPYGGSVASLDRQGYTSAPGQSQSQTFVEFSQSLVSELYWHHAMVPSNRLVSKHAKNYAKDMVMRSPYFRKIKSIHFHNQIVVFIEGDVTEGNEDQKRGDEWIPIV